MQPIDRLDDASEAHGQFRRHNWSMSTSGEKNRPTTEHLPIRKKGASKPSFFATPTKGHYETAWPDAPFGARSKHACYSSRARRPRLVVLCEAVTRRSRVVQIVFMAVRPARLAVYSLSRFRVAIYRVAAEEQPRRTPDNYQYNYPPRGRGRPEQGRLFTYNLSAALARMTTIRSSMRAFAAAGVAALYRFSMAVTSEWPPSTHFFPPRRLRPCESSQRHNARGPHAGFWAASIKNQIVPCSAGSWINNIGSCGLGFQPKGLRSGRDLAGHSGG